MAPAQEAPPAPTRESAATLVVYNNFDPSSVDLAAYYAKRRAIPLDHIVGLNCPATEEISRAQYDETIADPLRKIFADRGWWHAPADPSLPVSDNQDRFVALMRGIPLKIANAPNYPGDSFTGKQQALDTNAAAVDSELATLGVRTRKISGPMKNLYYQSFTPFMDTPLAAIMLVCRLDAPTAATARDMIDGAIFAERRGSRASGMSICAGSPTARSSKGTNGSRRRPSSCANTECRSYGIPRRICFRRIFRWITRRFTWDGTPRRRPARWRGMISGSNRGNRGPHPLLQRGHAARPKSELGRAAARARRRGDAWQCV